MESNESFETKKGFGACPESANRPCQVISCLRGNQRLHTIQLRCEIFEMSAEIEPLGCTRDAVELALAQNATGS
jgi:hypothetical protein